MDLCLYKTLLLNRSVNSVIAKSAPRVLNCHLWYPTQEMVVLAIFDTNVLIKERQDMADRLIQACRITNHTSQPLWQRLCKTPLNTDTSVVDLFGPDS